MLNGKGGKPGYTTLSENVTDLVYDHVKTKKLTHEDLLITNKLGKAYKSGCYLNRILNRYCKKVLDPPINKKITNHTFRHMFCITSIIFF